MMTKPAQYVITLLAIIFLFFLGSNSYTVLIRYIIFIIMLLVPGSAISGWLIFPRHFSFSFKFFGGFFLFLPTLIPVYLLRKLTLFPHYYFDMIFVAILWFFFYKITLYKKIIKLFKSDDLRKSIPILLIVLPACFYLIWLGNGVNFKDKIRYFGLFPVDFGNLASVVTLIKISDFLPLSDVAGSGLLHYHWFYFVLPAYFCDFMGGEVNSANALILTNLVVAFNFFYILLEFVRIVIQPTLGLYSRVFAVSVVLFAPTIIYFYQELSIILAVDSFNLGVRNHLLLSPINSLVNFGNNIVAIGLIIILCMRLVHK